MPARSSTLLRGWRARSEHEPNPTRRSAAQRCQKLGHPVGFLNPLLYGSLAGRGLFNDIVNGNNGSYSAKSGWDACTGWGSPIGSKLLTALGG